VNVATTTLGTVTAKVEGTSLTQSTFTAGTIAARRFIVDTTVAANFWVYKLVSGSTWSLSQPISPVLPDTFNFPSEVAVVSGNAVTVNTLVNVDLVDFEPILSDYDSNFTNQGTLYRLNVLAAGANAGAAVHMNNDVQCLECSSDRPVDIVGTRYGITHWFNANLAGGLYGGGVGIDNFASHLVPAQVAGVVGAASTSWPSSLNLNFDTILSNSAGSGAFTSTVQFLAVGTGYLDGGLNVIGGVDLSVSAQFFDSSNVLWGPGTLNMAGTSRLHYAAGAGAAAAALKVTTIQANGQTKVCLGNPAASTTTLPCNITLSAATLDTQLGTTVPAGSLFNPGGASYSNGLL
jgi:hypothetical protein